MSHFPKICIIVTQPEWGGAQRYVYDLALGLHKKGLSVTVGTGRGEPVLLNKLKDKGVKIHQFAHVLRSISLLEEIYAFVELWHYFREQRFDVVHLNSSKVGVVGAIAAKLARVKKVIFTAHGFVFNEKQSFLTKWFYIFLTWFGFLFTDHVIAVSEYDRHSALQLKIISPKKITTIYNGVEQTDQYFLEKKEARKVISQKIGHDIPHDAKVVGTIANFYENKGLRYLIDAASRVVRESSKTLFIVLGDGKMRKELEQYIKRYKLEAYVLLPGFFEEAERYVKAFDVYVSSSLKEGLPYSLIEARSAGVPIVATAVGGVPEIVGTECGVLVAKEDSKKLAEQILAVLKHGAHFEARHDTFLLSEMVEKTLQIYEII
ncbi:MAG: hypothetical protein COV34_02820 [Candidatus Zambryskibacteria bacterium CG10_big_fil_rev_8_21_14_0_10_42_12]|uniref:Glycosyltransferase subfamily 4-like N-terminal domain-containing protein n=1 Tax=Candidatus Zambryskibacteria bacterium CG10_big_fil_rev_8_21_14_0_10_42_12 TaxID=1975115 RepID=A0A2H0QWL1_9BACT|nr:MAG: hypothetical protein COV34_02820 [Candidatus Zambryskibacteria bacterium CG10_big_fil_rev_8_21_14_0_10_42_12]